MATRDELEAAIDVLIKAVLRARMRRDEDEFGEPIMTINDQVVDECAEELLARLAPAPVAGVTITEAAVERGAQTLSPLSSVWDDMDDANRDWYRLRARRCLTAALAQEGDATE